MHHDTDDDDDDDFGPVDPYWECEECGHCPSLSADEKQRAQTPDGKEWLKNRVRKCPMCKSDGYHVVGV